MTSQTRERTKASSGRLVVVSSFADLQPHRLVGQRPARRWCDVDSAAAAALLGKVRSGRRRRNIPPPRRPPLQVRIAPARRRVATQSGAISDRAKRATATARAQKQRRNQTKTGAHTSLYRPPCWPAAGRKKLHNRHLLWSQGVVRFRPVPFGGKLCDAEL